MIHTRATWFLIFSLLLAACGPRTAADPTATQVDPQAVFTAAAETAAARMTEMALVTPTAVPATATPTPTATQVVSATVTATATQAAVVQTGIDKLSYVADVTVPDGTNFAPGEAFVKTWRLRNDGTTTWNSSYSLIFFSGSQMNGSPSAPLTTEVAPGATMDISINLTAPATAGVHVGYWMLRNPAGKNFGLGPNADGPFYVQINVTGSTVTGTVAPTTTGTPGTPTPTATATVAGASSVVKDAAISVDVGSYEGTCPYAFNFTAEFTLNQAATVTYQLEAETGFTIQLPAATTVALGAGKQTVNYRLEFTDSVTGWARLHITAPENVLSNQVNFKLTCK